MSTADAETDPLQDYEEEGKAAIRRHLGLRRIVYRDEDAAADPRPCPSWCWVAESVGDEHEVDWEHPLSAVHSAADGPSVVATHYRGQHSPQCGDYPAHVSTATWEFSLDQVGQDDPKIRVHLRYWLRHNAAGRFEERMRLSVDDAREVAAVLQHLIGVAEAG